MPKAWDTIGILHQNLLDAGCDEQTINTCIQYYQNEEWFKITTLLLKQKKILLANIHTGQKQVDCLDFLVYKINKEHKEK